MLKDIRIEFTKPIGIHCDNTRIVNMSKNPIFVRYARGYAPSYIRVDDERVHQSNVIEYNCLSRLNVDASYMGEYL